MIHIFIGTKAQLIKMAPIMRTLQEKKINYNFIFSGQHQDTINDLRSNFGIKDPDIILYKGNDITGIAQMLAWMVGILFKTLFAKKKLWQGDKNGIVLNHGDTFSTLLGSLLAKLHGHRNAHIESGLRSFDIFNPFPEELVRRIVFLLTNLYYCPNEIAKENLHHHSGEKIITNGNTLYDALCTIKQQPTPDTLNIPPVPFAITSFHRFENIFNDSKLEKI
ncbi:MAG TPA: UDP-N-acetylglucosamine 2-epimerase, partial [Cellvibrio sp.]